MDTELTNKEDNTEPPTARATASSLRKGSAPPTPNFEAGVNPALKSLDGITEQVLGSATHLGDIMKSYLRPIEDENLPVIAPSSVNPDASEIQNSITNVISKLEYLERILRDITNRVDR